ncbi:helix-turn-helix domain-containing protein [Citreicella sp. C3M06]|uniref:helix-turn-helix domain-containing protein n=1 Tax=Citreicella sp. C3M06 TaxID=2841564 RepID=UPI001C08CFC7|nr:helix-turn-helix domain-containing protein [Citreicella sp. C3M06]MBU2962737.1 helix-turn-helix domain-containing protein [Citreicella sp. C3M06]
MTKTLKAASKRARLILDLSKQGAPIADIAEKAGCSRATIGRIRAENGFRAERSGVPSKFSDEVIRSTHERGLIDKLAAEEIGISVAYYGRRRRALGLRSHALPGMPPAISDDTIRELHAQGLSDIEAAGVCGCHPSTFNRRRLRLDLPANRKRADWPVPGSPTLVSPDVSRPNLVEKTVRGAFAIDTARVEILRAAEPLVARAMGALT